jgi:hypothetical protein
MGLWWRVMVVQPDIALEHGFEILAATEMVRTQDLGDAAVEALDHAVGLGPARRDEAVRDVELDAALIKAVPSRWAGAGRSTAGAYFEEGGHPGPDIYVQVGEAKTLLADGRRHAECAPAGGRRGKDRRIPRHAARLPAPRRHPAGGQGRDRAHGEVGAAQAGPEPKSS